MDEIMPFSRDYSALLTDIKQRIRTAQIRTTLAANASLLMLYWEIGGVLAERQKKEGWGTGVLPRLATDLRNSLPEVKGFSARNLNCMVQFFREYPALFPIWTQPAAKLTDRSPAAAISQQAVAKLPWGHNVILIQKVKDRPTRLWYAQQAFEYGWSRHVLSLQIRSRAHQRQGKAVTNFTRTLPPTQSDLAAELLKDPYVFDFLTLEKPFRERELETGLPKKFQSALPSIAQLEQELSRARTAAPATGRKRR